MFQPLYNDLDAAVTSQTALFENLRDTLTELNAIGDQITAPANDEIDAQLNLVRSLRRKLETLSPKAADIDAALEKPEKFVQHPIVPKKLTDRIDELQSAISAREATLQQAAQFRAVAPDIIKTNEKLDVQLEGLATSMPDSLEHQQALLHDFETEKRRLEETLAALPGGDEADALRERSQWNLSRIKDWLKRLADAVGDRLAALAAFHATRDDIDRRLADLRNQMRATKDIAQRDDPKTHEDNIHRQEVNPGLHSSQHFKHYFQANIEHLGRLADILTAASSADLDAESAAEADRLQREIAAMLQECQVIQT